MAEANGFSVEGRRAGGIPTDLAASTASRRVQPIGPPRRCGGLVGAFAMVADAGRALYPGGELWLVFNSHLPYLPVAREQVGPTRVVVRDPSYIVTCSTKR